MARKARDSRLDTRTVRLKLAPAKEPYWRVLEPGRALGYRRLADGKPGTWTARHGERVGGRHVYQFQALGTADDYSDADDIAVMTFGQAQETARGFFAALLASPAKTAAPITVAEAVADHMADYEARSARATAAMLLTVNAHILPALGKVLVKDLTAQRIRDWRNALVKAPPRRRKPAVGKRTLPYNAAVSAARATKAPVIDPRERLRQRQSTVNRVLTILKAALNLAFRNGRVDSDLAWRRVPPFPGANQPRIRYLTDDEAVRLVNACPPDFRRLVIAALLTGADYGELRTARVRDLDLGAHTAGVGKKRGWHQVVLTDEAARHFATAAVGKAPDALLFVRSDGEAWGASHQQRPLEIACGAASIEPFNFHILRHTYATRALRMGAGMLYVSAQLGHKDIRTTQRHYAHLVPSDMAAAIRAVPPLGIGEVSNVTALRHG